MRAFLSAQDEKKGKPRLYHGPIYWNYGCMPQTWESPNHNGGPKARAASHTRLCTHNGDRLEGATQSERPPTPQVGNCAGDNDPLDAVEIGERALEMGSFTPVKPLGVLSMLDDGELDWCAAGVRKGLSNLDVDSFTLGVRLA